MEEVDQIELTYSKKNQKSNRSNGGVFLSLFFFSFFTMKAKVNLFLFYFFSLFFFFSSLFIVFFPFFVFFSSSTSQVLPPFIFFTSLMAKVIITMGFAKRCHTLVQSGVSGTVIHTNHTRHQ